MIDSTDTMSIIHRLIQPNIKMLLLISLIVILMLKYFNTNVVLILSFIMNILIFHKEILNTFQEIQRSETRTERIIENNKRTKKEIHFDDNINKIILKLRKYRRYNINAYDEGYKYIKMFMFIIHDLERDEISHPKQYFENAQLYLKQSLNNFTAITNPDGGYTINFTNNKNKINYLNIFDGWNYTIRMYEPKKEILTGEWKFPNLVEI